MTAYKLIALVFSVLVAAVLFALAALGYTNREPCCPEQAAAAECCPEHGTAADLQQEVDHGS